MTDSVDTKVTKLKNDMQRLINAICEADECSYETLQETVNVMRCLREYRRRLESSRVTGNEVKADFDIPELFKCPFSHRLMKDPVILSTGETCDREFIEQWLSEGNRISPASKEVISHTMLVPNDLVRDMISNWEKGFGRLPPSKDQVIDEVITQDELAKAEAGKLDLDSLLTAINGDDLEAKQAAKKLQGLVTRSVKFRASLGKNIEAINHMLRPIYSTVDISPNENLRKDLVITLYHLSKCDDNKEILVEHTPAVSVLSESLTHGINETVRYAAGTLFLMSKVETTRLIIGPAALKTLLKVLKEGDPWNFTIIAALINRLCTVDMNLCTALHEGAVKLAMTRIKARIEVEEMLELLFKFSSISQAIEEMIRENVKSCIEDLPMEFPPSSPVMNYCEIIDRLLDTYLSNLHEPTSQDEKYQNLVNRFTKTVSISSI